MEKRKLKKLKINRIKDEFPIIGSQEQMEMKGGANGAQEYYIKYNQTLPDGVGYNPTQDTCYALPNSSSGSEDSGKTYGDGSCPACDRFHNLNNPPVGNNHQHTTTPLGEFLFNTMPHYYGWGDHTGN